MIETEKPAAGVSGFILYDPTSGEYFFRVYELTKNFADHTPTKKNFTDYALGAEEIAVNILSDKLSLYEGEEGNYLGWSSKYVKGGSQKEI